MSCSCPQLPTLTSLRPCSTDCFSHLSISTVDGDVVLDTTTEHANTLLAEVSTRVDSGLTSVLTVNRELDDKAALEAVQSSL